LIQEFPIKKIPIDEIKFDNTNPNRLTPEQMSSLNLAMQKFGNVAPVILNSDMQVVDGEHRVRTYQELGLKKIPAIVIDVPEIDKKMLRQVMNKFRGEHDPEMDKAEFKIINESGKLEEFSLMMAKPIDSFEKIIDTVDELPTDNTPIELESEIAHRCIVEGCDHGQ